MTKKELEDAAKEGRVDILHVLLRDNTKKSPDKDKLIKFLLDQKEYICEDGEHYGENAIDLSLVFDDSDHEYREYLESMIGEHDGEVPIFHDKELDKQIEQSL